MRSPQSILLPRPMHQSSILCALPCADRFWEDRYKATWKSGIQTPMAQGRSTTIISMIQWTRTSRLSIKISLSLQIDQERAGRRAEADVKRRGLARTALRIDVLPLLTTHTTFPTLFFKSFPRNILCQTSLVNTALSVCNPPPVFRTNHFASRDSPQRYFARGIGSTFSLRRKWLDRNTGRVFSLTASRGALIRSKRFSKSVSNESAGFAFRKGRNYEGAQTL